MHALSVDEVMNLVAVNFYQDLRFSYASFVRGKKDWKKECFFDSTEETAGFNAGRLFGESFTALAYPDDMEDGIFTHIKNLCIRFVIVIQYEKSFLYLGYIFCYFPVTDFSG